MKSRKLSLGLVGALAMAAAFVVSQIAQGSKRLSCSVSSHQIQSAAPESETCSSDTPDFISQQLSLEGKTWSRFCNYTEDVCVDQGTFVFYGPEYSYFNKTRTKISGFVPRVSFNFPFKADANPGYFNRDAVNYEQPYVHFRTGSVREANEDLRNPKFSNCSVPLFVWVHWPYNYAHFWVQTLTWLVPLINSTAIRPFVKLVMATPYGLQYPGYQSVFLQPLSSQPVQTLAELSNRPSTDDGTTAQPRCYKRAFMCLHTEGVTHPWKVGQFYNEVYGGANDVAKAVQPTGTIGDELLVVFAIRLGGNRIIQNVPQLLEKCEGRSIKVKNKIVRLKCVGHEFSNPQNDVALMRKADVLVGLHGSQMYNGYMMKRGSSIIEIHNYKFCHDGMHWWLHNQKVFIFYWQLDIDDKNAYVSSKELPGSPKQGDGILRWDAVQQMLEKIVKLNGNAEAYDRIWREKAYWFGVPPSPAPLRPQNGCRFDH